MEDMIDLVRLIGWSCLLAISTLYLAVGLLIVHIDNSSSASGHLLPAITYAVPEEQPQNVGPYLALTWGCRKRWLMSRSGHLQYILCCRPNHVICALQLRLRLHVSLGWTGQWMGDTGDENVLLSNFMAVQTNTEDISDEEIEMTGHWPRFLIISRVKEQAYEQMI